MTSHPLVAPIWLVTLAALLAGCAATTTSSTQTGTAPATAMATGTDLVSTDDPSYKMPTHPHAVSYLTLQSVAGVDAWPNNGQMRIYSFAWGGGRPQPAPLAADTVGQPLEIPGGTPTLNIQKRIDSFSPILQTLFEQQSQIEHITFTIDPQTDARTTFNLHDVRVAMVRPVGPQDGVIPPSEEIILVFGRITRE